MNSNNIPYPVILDAIKITLKKRGTITPRIITSRISRYHDVETEIGLGIVISKILGKFVRMGILERIDFLSSVSRYKLKDGIDPSQMDLVMNEGKIFKKYSNNDESDNSMNQVQSCENIPSTHASLEMIK